MSEVGASFKKKGCRDGHAGSSGRASGWAANCVWRATTIALAGLRLSGGFIPKLDAWLGGAGRLQPGTEPDGRHPGRGGIELVALGPEGRNLDGAGRRGYAVGQPGRGVAAGPNAVQWPKPAVHRERATGAAGAGHLDDRGSSEPKPGAGVSARCPRLHNAVADAGKR